MLTQTRQIHPPVRALARRLPEVHSAVYQALMLLMPDGLSRSDCLVSRVGEGPDLYMYVAERHDYTTYLRLTYLIGAEQRHDPNAHIRVYHDAHMAEATAFSPQQGLQRLAGPDLPMHGLIVRSWRMNRALLKWLDYVLAQGHHATTFTAVEETPSSLVEAA